MLLWIILVAGKKKKNTEAQISDLGLERRFAHWVLDTYESGLVWWKS